VPTNIEQLREIMRINGGQQEGNNLFHSFEDFSIPEGMEAIFENSPDIQNIFARVTGDDASNINGILSTQGDANFFFINPNGIIFGDNAQLNVGGSFLASTAETIQFDDDNQFSATNSDEPLLDLTGFPVGLGLGSNPGPITVNGNGNQIKDGSLFSPIDLANIEEGLSVKSGKTLALIGGNITFNAGSVNTKSGQVEIAAIDKGNLINFQPSENKWIFNYDKQEIINGDFEFLDTVLRGDGWIGYSHLSIEQNISEFINRDCTHQRFFDSDQPEFQLLLASLESENI
jgi:filamentous hemagglutinin family protein